MLFSKTQNTHIRKIHLFQIIFLKPISQVNFLGRAIWLCLMVLEKALPSAEVLVGNDWEVSMQIWVSGGTAGLCYCPHKIKEFMQHCSSILFLSLLFPSSR